ncbi:MAG: hypothetical protein QM775_32185 [Pirellulales bacterium]
MQRLRDAENDKNFGEFAAHEGEIVGGVVQADARARARGFVAVHVGPENGGHDAVLPPAEQVPGERYEHGERIKFYVVGVSRGQRGIQITLSRTHPSLVKKLFALEVPEIADGSVEIVVGRPRGRAPLEDRRPIYGPRPQRQGRVYRTRWASGCATS